MHRIGESGAVTQPPVTLGVCRSFSAVAIEKESVVLETMKPAEDGSGDNSKSRTRVNKQGCGFSGSVRRCALRQLLEFFAMFHNDLFHDFIVSLHGLVPFYGILILIIG